MRTLDRKMLRDLRRIWAQTLAIALVLGCGVMVNYERHLFADVFAGARLYAEQKANFAKVAAPT